MANRYSHKDSEYAFFRLMRQINGDHNPENPYSGYVNGKAVIGRYVLDYAPMYGGMCIDRITSDTGSETRVTQRMTNRDFCNAVDFMGRMLDESR